jgi:hypothetical protein
MDTDDGGSLDRGEIRILARSLGNQLTGISQSDIMAIHLGAHKLLRHLRIATDEQLSQEDESGEVDFDEFFEWYARLRTVFSSFGSCGSASDLRHLHFGTY